MPNIVLKFIVVAGLALGYVSKCQACSCEMESVEDGLLSSDFVFLAQIDSATAGQRDGFEVISFDFSKPIVKKGGELPFKSVKTPVGRAACGKSLLVPGKYWLFTDKGGFFTKCSATAVADDPRMTKLTQDVWDELVEQKRKDARELKDGR